jgi:hypothetical protein
VETVQNGWEIVASGRRVHMTAPVCKLQESFVNIEATVERGLIAPSYGTVREATWLRWRWSGTLPSTVTVTITKAAG